VLNALHRLRDLGLLTWERQFTRVHGWRLQVANRYLFVSNLPLPPARAARSVQAKKEGKMASFLGRQPLCSGAKRTEMAELQRAAAALPDLLLARRRAWEAGMVRA
jgi:hypothetical protein